MGFRQKDLKIPGSLENMPLLILETASVKRYSISRLLFLIDYCRIGGQSGPKTVGDNEKEEAMQKKVSTR